MGNRCLPGLCNAHWASGDLPLFSTGAICLDGIRNSAPMYFITRHAQCRLLAGCYKCFCRRYKRTIVLTPEQFQDGGRERIRRAYGCGNEKPMRGEMTHAEQLAEFVSRASFDDISEAARAQLKIRVLDSLGCVIGALHCGPTELVRNQVEEFDGKGSCTLIGGAEYVRDRRSARPHRTQRKGSLASRSRDGTWLASCARGGKRKERISIYGRPLRSGGSWCFRAACRV
jgi:hypothetical protein